MKTMNKELRNYYRNQISKIENPKFGFSAKIQIRKDDQKTNWLDLNDDSASEIVKFLTENFNVTIQQDVTFSLAKEFTRLLEKEIGEDFTKLVELTKNHFSENCCYAHDYCDANIVMAEAFENIMGREIDLNSEDDMNLFNSAWTFAKQNYFFK